MTPPRPWRALLRVGGSPRSLWRFKLRRDARSDWPPSHSVPAQGPARAREMWRFRSVLLPTLTRLRPQKALSDSWNAALSHDPDPVVAKGLGGWVPWPLCAERVSVPEKQLQDPDAGCPSLKDCPVGPSFIGAEEVGLAETHADGEPENSARGLGEVIASRYRSSQECLN